MRRWIALLALGIAACGVESPTAELTFSGSALGKEAEIVRTQIARFSKARAVTVEIRPTPDAADQRHQLYVQWLNARAEQPDVLQLDVVWTPEFAGAGWLLPLDRFAPPVESFFPSTIAANTWQGTLYALPWFVDVGVLYWRRDLLDAPPATFDALAAEVPRVQRQAKLKFGFVWQGARYEGLVASFLEHLGGFGGRIFDESGRVVVDSPQAIRALTYMRDAIYVDGFVPPSVLTWHEEETRFAFQNGEAVLMRNWPYAYSLLQQPDSRVAGRVGIAPLPAQPGGRPTAALGGSQLAINARSTRANEAYELIAYLTAPEQMLERARVVGQYPPRRDLYDSPDLEQALGVPTADLRRIIERATPRPVTPVYTELSEILQIHLHEALTNQQEPDVALRDAAREIRVLLENSGLLPSPTAELME